MSALPLSRPKAPCGRRGSRTNGARRGATGWRRKSCSNRSLMQAAQRKSRPDLWGKSPNSITKSRKDESTKKTDGDFFVFSAFRAFVMEFELVFLFHLLHNPPGHFLRRGGMDAMSLHWHDVQLDVGRLVPLDSDLDQFPAIGDYLLSAHAEIIVADTNPDRPPGQFICFVAER